MVAVLNTYTHDSNPINLTNVGGTVFFSANVQDNQAALFKTDGTPGGTTQLTFGNRLSSFSHFVNLGGKLVFTATDATFGYQDLWTSDGTVAGTVPFLAGGDNVAVYYSGNYPETVVGSKLFFQAYDWTNNSYDLWVSNGTSTGTHAVQPNTSAPTNLANFTSFNNKLYFDNYNGSTGNYELWSSDGTAGGTGVVTPLNSNQPFNYTVVGSTLYFEEYDSTNSLYALWKSNGTAAGTSMVADIGTTGNQFDQLTGFNSKLYFQVVDSTAPNTGWALWSYDGTHAPAAFKYASGVTPVQLQGNSQMQVFGSALYFSGYDTTNGFSLWKTDGSSTTSNTGNVETSGSTPYNYYPEYLTVLGSTLYFVAQNSGDSSSYDLWKTTGTSASTVPVTSSSVVRGIGQDNNQGMVATSSQLFFPAYDVDSGGNYPHGWEIWASTGTAAGTAMLKDINTTPDDSYPQNFVAVGNEMFFTANTSYPNANGTFLWQSDGTSANTLLVQTSTGTVPTSEGNYTAVGNTLFFTANGTNGDDLWTSGTATKSAVELFASSATNPFGGAFASGNGDAFVNLNGTLYFGAYDQANSKWALWKSNGTAAGTVVVADLDPGNQMYHLTVVGTNLFWTQWDSATSTYAIWKSNGTTASMVADVNNSGSEPYGLMGVGSTLFFAAYDPTPAQFALWTSNGTTVTKVGDIFGGYSTFSPIAFNGKLFFGAYAINSSNNTRFELWSSDGTLAGTTLFLNGAGQPVALNNTPYFTIVGSKLYFSNFDLNYRDQLGVTDGTAAGTGTVQAGTTGSTMADNVAYIANDNGTLVFEGSDNTHGYELWQSDGTANGTMVSADIVPGSGSSYPQYMTVAGNQVFFQATDGVNGYQLWTATLAANVVTGGLAGPTDGVTMQHRSYVLTANDSASSNNSAGFSFAVNWGDGTSQTITGASGLTADHQYANTGPYTITVVATNLTDNVASTAVTQVVNITSTEIQGGNVAIGGVAGNNAFVITKGSSSSFIVKDNGSTALPAYAPASGQEIILYPGNGTDTITINDSLTTKDTFTLGHDYVTFNKGTFVVSNTTGSAIPWTITGNNSASGNIFNIVGPANASITGGTGPDTFNFTTTVSPLGTISGSLSGTLNGGGGVNTLSYAKYTASGVVVDLPLGSATGVAGAISNIQNITGSANGGDILVGDANVNVLRVNKGHNILIGGSGGGDTLWSAGADIMIAGTTSYDSNIAALQTILATWKTATLSNYQTVISTIESASFADPLDGLSGPAAQSVFDSGTNDLPDTLNGKSTSDLDWFFAHTTGSTPYDILNNKGSTDTLTNI